MNVLEYGETITQGRHESQRFTLNPIVELDPNDPVIDLSGLPAEWDTFVNFVEHDLEEHEKLTLFTVIAHRLNLCDLDPNRQTAIVMADIATFVGGTGAAVKIIFDLLSR